MPKYSFIIPVYGCENDLEACVSSILAQKGDHDSEVILVDDGSRDRSGQIADELARRDSRIHTFHKENGGAASARNFGLRKATGEYILFIDGDDTVEDQLLNSVDAALKLAPDAMIIFGMSFDYYQNRTLVRSQILSCRHNGCYTAEQLLEDYQSFFYDNALSSACNKVFSAGIIRVLDLQMKEGMTLYEDYDFVLRYLTGIKSVICIAQPFYHYRNESSAGHPEHRVESLETLQENMRQLFRSAKTLSENSVQLQEVTANLYMRLLWKHLMRSRYSASELAEKAARYCEEPAFRAVLAGGGKLGGFEHELFRKIEEGAFRGLARDIKRKQITAWGKNLMKRFLGAVGIKRY